MCCWNHSQNQLPGCLSDSTRLECHSIISVRWASGSMLGRSGEHAKTAKATISGQENFLAWVVPMGPRVIFPLFPLPEFGEKRS